MKDKKTEVMKGNSHLLSANCYNFYFWNDRQTGRNSLQCVIGSNVIFLNLLLNKSAFQSKTHVPHANKSQTSTIRPWNDLYLVCDIDFNNSLDN